MQKSSRYKRKNNIKYKRTKKPSRNIKL